MKTTIIINIEDVKSSGEMEMVIERSMEVLAEVYSSKGYKFDIGYNPQEITESISS